MENTYCYSWDEEHYHGSHKTRADALADGRDNHPGVDIWTAKIVPFTPDYAGSADAVLIDLSEQAFEHAGEAAENWEIEGHAHLPDDELRIKLAEAIKKVVEEINHPTGFWGVADIELHEAPATADDEVQS